MKKYNLDIPGYTNEKELNILSTLSGYVQDNGSILEIGSFLGRSTVALFMGKKNNVSLDIVDTFEGNFSPFDWNKVSFQASYAKGNPSLFLEAQEIAKKSDWFQAFKYCVGDEIVNNININITKSNSFVKEKDYDLIFVDGSHKFEDVILDLFNHKSRTTLLMGDDFQKKYPDVIKAVSFVKEYSTLIVFEDTKLFAIIPKLGYWRDVFKENNLLFL